MKFTHLTLYFSKSYLLDATAHLAIGKCSQSHTLWGLLFSCVLGNLEYVILGSYWAPLVEAHMTSWCWVLLLLLCQAWAQRCFSVLSVLLVFWPAHFPLFVHCSHHSPAIHSEGLPCKISWCRYLCNRKSFISAHPWPSTLLPNQCE